VLTTLSLGSVVVIWLKSPWDMLNSTTYKMFMAFYDADIYIPLLVSSALQLFATINIILSSSSISTPISDFAVEAVMSYHGHWNIHDVIVIVPPKWSRVWSQLITSFRLNKILYDFLSSEIVMCDVKFTTVSNVCCTVWYLTCHHGLQEKLCKAKQECFEATGTDWAFSQNWGFEVH
jgi:hypothetical protein